MADDQCEVEIKTDPEHSRRAVAFLKKPGSSFVNVDEAFNDLDEDVQNYFRTSFDYWKDGEIKKHRYHGWNKSDYGGKYQHCFVFKHEYHRIYGFLCHPKEPENKQFQACVLVCHGKKKKWKTNPEELKRAESMRKDADVQEACNKEFSKEGGKS